MIKTFIIVFLTVATTQALSLFNVTLDEWKFYKTSTKRHFRNANEEFSRLKTFLETKDLVAKHNERYLKGLEDYKITLNHFSDWLPYEKTEGEVVESRYMKERREIQEKKKISGKGFRPPKNILLPKEVNWNKAGALNKVLNQGLCGSCYAFTAVSALEAQIFIKTKVLPLLSVQQILDCSRSFGNDGCDGGTFGQTFKYLMKTGVAPDNLYPYEGYAEKCRINNKPLSLKVKKYYHMTDGNEENLKYALATIGPVAIGIDAAPRTFQLYSGGIYSDPSCSSTLVHAVLLTGYGTDKKTKKDYWIIKNTWGRHWGEKGFMRLARNAKNLCGVGKLAYVPVLD